MAKTSDYEVRSTATDSEQPAPNLDYQPKVPINPDKYPIALIGCGGISEFHLRNYRAAGFKVIALCDQFREKAVQRQQEFYPEAQVYSDPVRMLEAEANIAVVDIATHPENRAELIPQVLKYQKQILSQKPFVTDLELGQKLVAQAEDQGVLLAVNQNGRWAPYISYLRQAIAAGLVGEVVDIDFSVQFDHNWCADNPAFNNIPHLVLYDWGIHWFDQTNCFLPGRRPRYVQAHTGRAQGQRMRPPALAQVHIDYEDCQVSIHFCANTRYGQQNRTVVVGTQGTLLSSGTDLVDHTVWLFNAEAKQQAKLQGSWFEQGFVGSMSELLCALEQRREPYHSAANNLLSLELCYTALASAEAGGQKIPFGTVKKLEQNWLSYGDT